MPNARRLELQSKLEELLESRNVYFQPPEDIKMKYPAIRYSRSKIESTFANDAAYSFSNRYEVIVISKTPDHPVIEKLLTTPQCSHDRHYVASGMNHDVFTLYY